jgi:hypothetical protein
VIETGTNMGPFQATHVKNLHSVKDAFVRLSVETQIKPIYQSDNSLRIFDSKEKLVWFITMKK